MTELEPLAGGVEPVGDVAGAVVRHDGEDLDAAVLEPSDRASEKAGGGRGSLVRQNLGVGQAGGVVYGDVDELPADASGVLSTIAGDAMADTADAAQLLDVDVDQLARAIPLIPDDRLFELQALETRQAVASQDASDRGRAQAQPNCDLGARVSSLSQTQYLLNPIRVGLSGHPKGSGAAIDQGRLAGLFESPLPLEGRPPGYTGRRGGPSHRHPSQDSSDQQHSTPRGNSGILVKLHLGSFVETVALNTSSLTDLGPDGQQTSPVNNVLRNES
jgi:hypothetical protein